MRPIELLPVSDLLPHSAGESGRVQEREQTGPEILPAAFIRRNEEVAGQGPGLEDQ